MTPHDKTIQRDKRNKTTLPITLFTVLALTNIPTKSDVSWGRRLGNNAKNRQMPSVTGSFIQTVKSNGHSRMDYKRHINSTFEGY